MTITRKCKTTTPVAHVCVWVCKARTEQRTNEQTRTAGAAVFLLAASFSCSSLVSTYPLRNRSTVDSIRKSKSRDARNQPPFHGLWWPTYLSVPFSDNKRNNFLDEDNSKTIRKLMVSVRNIQDKVQETVYIVPLFHMHLSRK